MAFLISKPKKRFKKARAGNADEILSKLNRYLDKNTGEPVKLLCGFWKDQANSISYQELRSAVMAGFLNEEIFRELSKDYSVLVSSKLRSMWTGAMSAGSISQALTEKLTDFTYNLNKPSVLSWIEDRGGMFIRNCMEEQREAISCLLEKAVVEKHSVDELSRLIRPCIGLTKSQSSANVKYYDSIVKNLKEAHPKMKESSIRKKAMDAASKFAERQHRDRAMTIAMTEMASAYNYGADDGIRQAQDLGLIGTVKKRWITSGDSSVCEMCQGFEGMELEMDQEWNFGKGWNKGGSNLTPPAHPRCACAVEYIEV